VAPYVLALVFRALCDVELVQFATTSSQWTSQLAVDAFQTLSGLYSVQQNTPTEVSDENFMRNINLSINQSINQSIRTI